MVTRTGRLNPLGRIGAVLVLTVILVAAGWQVARAAWSTSTANSGNGVQAYTIPAPPNIRCSGLVSLLTSRIEWNAVTVPGALPVRYLITNPNNVTVTTTNLFHQLPTLLLLGQWQVRARVPSWNNWTSTPSTITTTGLLGLYLCSTP